MNGPQIPETPNTAREPTWTIAEAVHWLAIPMPLGRGTLSKLGRDCSMVSRIRKRPIDVVPVIGKDWPSEKAYTRDVLTEVFRLHPATKDYVQQEPQA